jgi:acetyl esterase
MQRLTLLVCAAAALLRFAGTVSAQQSPAGAPLPPALAGARSEIYKSVGGVDLRLHVFAAAGGDGGSRPAIVLFFGGGWSAGSVAQFAPQAEYLASRGMVAIVADYRVASRHQTSAFEAMADARSAIRWVRAHASELGIDPARVLAGGGSSGGHLALAAAVFDRFDDPADDRRVSVKPAALVLFNPAVDPKNVLFNGREKEASPLRHVKAGLPPTLIVHGRADTTVPYTEVEQYCVAAVSAGNQCTLVGYDDASHGFFNRQVADGRWFRETLDEADRFLVAHGFIAPRTR